MKKKLAILLITAMICGLTACTIDGSTHTSQVGQAGQDDPLAAQINTSVDEPGDDVANLTVMWWGGAVREERTQAVLDLYHSNNPGVTFETESVAWADYWNELEAKHESDSLPDIVQIDYTFLASSVNNGMLVDLTPYLANRTLDLSGVDPGLISAGAVNGGVYSICVGVNVPTLMYNKTLLDELGIEIKDNMTLEEFYEVARQVYEKAGVKTDIAHGTSYNYFPYILRAKDITKLFKNDNSLNVSSAADFEEFFNIYETGASEGWIMGNDGYTDLVDGSVDKNPLILYTTPETQSWCGFFWSNQLTTLTDLAPDGIEIGVTTWPSYDPAKSDFLKPSMFLAVTTDAEEDEAAAVRVINYILNSKPANEILLAERGIPASSAVAEAIAPLLDQSGQTITTFINDVVTPNSSNVSPSDPETATKLYNYVDELVSKILDGELTAAEAAQELFEQGNDLMK